VKLLDFGIAAAPKEGNAGLTQEGVSLGTPAYMSPEQVLDQPLDGRSDLYSVGLVMAEMLTGRTVFQGSVGDADRAHPDRAQPGAAGARGRLRAARPVRRARDPEGPRASVHLGARDAPRAEAVHGVDGDLGATARPTAEPRRRHRLASRGPRAAGGGLRRPREPPLRADEQLREHAARGARRAPSARSLRLEGRADRRVRRPGGDRDRRGHLRRHGHEDEGRQEDRVERSDPEGPSTQRTGAGRPTRRTRSKKQVERMEKELLDELIKVPDARVHAFARGGCLHGEGRDRGSGGRAPAEGRLFLHQLRADRRSGDPVAGQGSRVRRAAIQKRCPRCSARPWR
jgi:hypothetical protein